MYEKLTKCPNVDSTWYLPKNFYKIPGFYMTFAGKIPEFYMIIVRKIFFPNFGRHVPPSLAPCLLRLWLYVRSEHAAWCRLLVCVCCRRRGYHVDNWLVDAEGGHLSAGVRGHGFHWSVRRHHGRSVLSWCPTMDLHRRHWNVPLRRSHRRGPFHVIRRLKSQKSTFFFTPLLFGLKFRGFPFGVDPWCWGLQRDERLG